MTDLMTELTATLRDYFDGRSVVAVRDPWARIVDGFLVRVHVTRWPGRVSLTADDFGLPANEYDQLAGKVRWGSLDLLPDEAGGTLESVSTLARQLPRQWGRVVHWGQFVPMSAMGPFREAWALLETRWNAALESWLADYDHHRALATDRAAAFAAQAWRNASRIGATDVDLDTFVDRAVARMLGMYPTREDLRRRFTLTFELAFIPTPGLEAEQALYAERVAIERAEQLAELKRQAELRDYAHELERVSALEALSAEELRQREKIELVRQFREETTARLQEQQAKLLADFYQGYALDIRQRLHESLMLLVEGVQGGSIRPQATRSLRVVLEEIKHLALDDDAEIGEMRQRLAGLLAQDKISTVGVQQEIEDFGVLLQTSILALGATPRLPKRMQQEGAPLDALVVLPDDPTIVAADLATRRRRAGLSSSLAESLAAAGDLTPTTLRRRKAGMFEGALA